MEPAKILTADLLDLVFENRNKLYGAYQLRKHYPDRLKISLVSTFALTGAALIAAAHFKTEEAFILPVKTTQVTISAFDPETKKPETVKKQVVQQKMKSEKFVVFKPVADDKVKDTPLLIADLKNAVIGVAKSEGDPYSSVQQPAMPAEPALAENAKPVESEILRSVDVEAKFIGNWIKFLQRNLNANVPWDNGARPGRYRVIIEFVVDAEGNISSIRPLTNMGHGMEEEAIRVIKKATKWEPALRGGAQVKAYRQQAITFEVLEE